MEVNSHYPERTSSINFTLISSLLSGFLLLGTGFLAGWYWQNASVQDMVKVEIVENSGKVAPNEAEIAALQSISTEESETDSSENCQFVGSKNSDKYHSPDSGSAKRILPENRVCFQTEEDAVEAGYEAGTLK